MSIEHTHCPYDHEHPQPFKGEDGKEYCGACWHRDKRLVEMVPCTDDICDAG
jgi:hypothetical protein